MKTPRFTPSLFAAACVTLLVTLAQADESSNSIKFSDPGKPGTVKISLGRGELIVVGADTNEVTVKTDAKVTSVKPRKDGLRVISDARSLALGEKDNVVTIDSAAQDWGRSGDFRLTVPRNTNIVVQNAWGGEITCKEISGDIEINSMRGEIKLEEVSGGVVAGTMQGTIHASIRELREGKPLSFTTMNGEVQIRLPETAKANVRLRTQNGAVLTDFEESALVTKTESATGLPRGRAIILGGKSKVLGAEVEDALREATRVSAIAVKEALEAVKQGLEDSQIGAEDARRKLEDARREIENARREANAETARQATERSRSRAPRASDAPETPETPAAAPKPPAVPKIATIPTITGGKLVTGTLNGGGPEISVSTMNGDVILRRLEKK